MSEAAGTTGFPSPAHAEPTGSLGVLRCSGCGDVIGVYEPLVVAEGSHWRTTSRAAEPALAMDGVHYHRPCFAQRDGQGNGDGRPNNGSGGGAGRL